MLLSNLIARSADRFPQKTALIFSNESISFGALRQQSSQVAARLTKLGIGPGNRVAILHENGLAAVVFFWGILQSGAQVVDIPYLSGVHRISKILAESKPAAVVVSETQLQRLLLGSSENLPSVLLTRRPASTKLPNFDHHSLTEIISSERADYLSPEVHESDVALVIYTSGTTGQPKGVMLSHRNLISNIYAVNSLMRLTSEDSILLVVPLHFIHGRMQLLTHALIGGTIAFSAGFHFPQRVVAELARYRVTGFSGVPYHFSMLLEHASLTESAVPSLRYALVMGGALPDTALRKLSRSLAKVAIHIGYGQTEASPRITNLAPSEVLSRIGSCGLPIPGVRVEIVDDNGQQKAPGETGEIVVSGPNVMCGYVSGDEVAAGTIDELGRLHTGDLGKLDNEGYLYVLGRKFDLIKSAGERIFPREIEAVLDLHPAVRESAVFGLPDGILGERIVACIVSQPGAEVKAEDLRTHCLQALPLVRVPRQIRFLDVLPKTGSGKIDRRSLADHFEDSGRLH